MTHYDTLGVEKGATEGDVREAFRRAAMRAHPDRGGTADEMAAVNRAYEVLSDPERRAAYDKTGDDADPMLEQRVNGLLSEIFSAWAPTNENLVHFARRKIDGARQQVTHEIAACKLRVERLQKKRGEVVVREGEPNIAWGVLDQLIAAAEREIAQHELALRVFGATEQRIEAYTHHQPEQQQATLASALGSRVFFTTTA